MNMTRSTTKKTKRYYLITRTWDKARSEPATSGSAIQFGSGEQEETIGFRIRVENREMERKQEEFSEERGRREWDEEEEEEEEKRDEVKRRFWRGLGGGKEGDIEEIDMGEKGA